MAVYTVHEPSRRGDDMLAHTSRFAFVRDGFHFWAFLLAPLWMLRHRLWLEFVFYCVIVGALTVALQRLGVPGAAAPAGLLLAVLIGMEASTLRRWKLARRGFTNRGIVIGDDRESAERRFFDAWTTQEDAPLSRPAPAMAPPALPRASAPDIVGLFPQPGVRS